MDIKGGIVEIVRGIFTVTLTAVVTSMEPQGSGWRYAALVERLRDCAISLR